ncbi:MAG: transketolase [Fusobacteria bacterium]|nr:transketolase [Fusobacteriota bacterium]
MDKTEIQKIERFALEIRLETLKQITIRGFGHLGGAMSVVELLAVLYGKVMNIDSKNPKKRDRDFLVCSKGHAGPAIYSTLALKGYFSMAELMTLNQNGTNLPSHCDMNKTIGIDMTTGSLGQGVSTAMGIAVGNRLDGLNNYTYLIVGDGELNEGQCWEGFMFAAHQKLDNLICFLDYNKKQLDGYLEEICNPFDFEEKFKAFGFETQKVNGASIEEIFKAIENAKNKKGMPHVIILDTIKGQGIDFVVEDGGHHMRFSEKHFIQASEAIKHFENLLKTPVNGGN